MSYAGIQMFMDKLNHLIINSNHIPSINNPEIICHRPLFQLLYQDLGSIIQTLSIHQHTDLEQLIDLQKRLIYAAEEAEYNVDLFLSSDFNRSLNLDDFRISLMFIKAEFKSMRIDGMKMDSSPRPQTTLNQSAAAAQSSISRGSKKLLDEINLFVGIDRDAELIRDKLVEDQKKLDVVSIVGMGGIGKTSVAWKRLRGAVPRTRNSPGTETCTGTAGNVSRPFLDRFVKSKAFLKMGDG